MFKFFTKNTVIPAKIWDSFWELALDTPIPADSPDGLSTTSVRGNLLDLEHVWLDADSPQSRYEPVPSHIKIVWVAGLPYWSGLTVTDQAKVYHYGLEVSMLLQAQQTRLKWLDKGPAFFPDGRCANYSDKPSPTERLYPAYNLVTLPNKIKLRNPRYDEHSHTATEMSSHPPVKEQWPPNSSRGALRDFMIAALLEEGVLAWALPIGSIAINTFTPTDFEGTLAIVAAPWFGSNTPPSQEDKSRDSLLTKSSQASKHVAIALGKLDFYLFA